MRIWSGFEKAVRDIGDVGLITIDPITAYMGGKIDSHKTTEVRSSARTAEGFRRADEHRDFNYHASTEGWRAKSN